MKRGREERKREEGKREGGEEGRREGGEEGRREGGEEEGGGGGGGWGGGEEEMKGRRGNSISYSQLKRTVNSEGSFPGILLNL